MQILKHIALLSCVLLLSAVDRNSLAEDKGTIEGSIESVIVKRYSANPLITFDSSVSLGDNINGPSVIRAPSWLKNPLGKYYMYFAHHRGKFIRLAYADSLKGPWKIYEPGTLQLRDASGFVRHIASPDVHVNDVSNEIILYFHGPRQDKKWQSTGVAVSKDGLHFEAFDAILGESYFRVFRWRECNYAIGGLGNMYRLKNANSKWVKREEKIISPVTIDDVYGLRNNVRIRHSAVIVKDDALYIFYSRKEDAPERIFVSKVTLTDNWDRWVASKPLEVIRPQQPYEGIIYPIAPSKKGRAIKVQQLRDPYVFEEDGRLYLFYSVSGEMGIALAEVDILDGDRHSEGSSIINDKPEK